jgi:hypothetical protein
MLETITKTIEVELDAAADAQEFAVLADMQLTFVGGGSGIAQLD